MPHFETNITADGDIILNGNQKEGDVVAAGGVFTGGAAQATTYSLHVGGKAKIDTISNATSDTDKFLVSDSGEIKYRTGTQLVSDLGAVSGFAYLPLAGNTTSTRITGEVYHSNLAGIYWRNFANTANTFAMLNDGNDDMFLINQTGGRHIDIINQATDGDIIFRADSGNGTETEYFRLDGSQASTGSALFTRWPDKSRVTFGNSNDLQMFHNATNSYIENTTGDLYIANDATDKDIIFQSDNGSGGLATYFYLDGGDAITRVARNFRANDSVALQVGSNGDAGFYHNGTDTYLSNDTGHINIINNAVDKSVIFQATSNGSGSNVTESYLSLLPSFGTGALFVYKDLLMAQDNTKIKLGASQDLEIYHNGSNSFISDTGTGLLVISSNHLQVYNAAISEFMITAVENGAVSLYYNGSKKLETKTGGVAVTGGLTVSGDVLDRDIPCLFNSNFEDGYGTSIIVVPFNNNTESNVSTRTYNHNLTMPYAGKLTKIIMKNVSGTLSSSFTTQLFLYVNGSQQASSSEISLSNSSVTWTPTTNNTFSAGDVLTFAYQKSALKTFGGVSFGVALELTDYDI